MPPRPATGGSPVKKALLVGGGVIGLTAAGVGAWAAYNFLTTGPQPADALPADTLGYVSVDLDPSGGQKIEALRTLNKFPAFEDVVGISPDDDLRKELFDKIQEEAQCEGLDYGDDIEPWLGNRAAIAAVDLGGEDPDAVVVVQVKDADKAETGLDKIKDCGGTGDGGWAIEGDWVVIAESDDVADDVVAATKKGSLADDDSFKKWTDEAGDPGVMTLYAGPAAGDYLADHADDLGFPFNPFFGGGTECYSEDGYETCSDTSADSSSDSPLPSEFEDQLRDFDGIAATLRFDDGAIELESAGDGSVASRFMLSGGATADVVTSLPADTAATYGLGFAEGWFSDIIEYLAPSMGQTPEELMEMLSEESGLDLPADAETLAGDSAAIALGSDFDPQSFFGSPDGSDIPVAVKVKGDPDEIEKVLEKLREMAGPDAGVLASDADGDTIVIGPNEDYRSEVLEDGDLGNDDVFQDVVREADQANTIMFVNVNSFEDAMAELAEGDDDVIDNLKPVSGFGVTAWVDGDTAHAVLRLTTD